LLVFLRPCSNIEQRITVVYSSAAHRASEAINLAALGGMAFRWVAIALADGRSDGVVYDTRADAIRHQFHESLCMYIKVTPDGLNPGDAELLLDFHRKAYDAGYRLSDPERPQHIVPQTRELMNTALRG
jgi:hypothetical protein